MLYKRSVIDFREAKHTADAFYDKAHQIALKGDFEMLPIAMLQCQNAEKAFLNQERKLRESKIRQYRLDEIPQENIVAEANRQFLLKVLHELKEIHGN